MVEANSSPPAADCILVRVQRAVWNSTNRRVSPVFMDLRLHFAYSWVVQFCYFLGNFPAPALYAGFNFAATDVFVGLSFVNNTCHGPAPWDAGLISRLPLFREFGTLFGHRRPWCPWWDCHFCALPSSH
jgi:hypothetical protein